MKKTAPKPPPAAKPAAAKAVTKTSNKPKEDEQESTLSLLNRFAKTNKNVAVKAITTKGECVIYTRVSSKEQADTGKSLEWQKKYCQEYAHKHNMTVAGTFGGTYESAKTDERKEFKRMLDFVQKSKGKISCILVYSIDRFSRSGAEAIAIAGDLKKKGITILAVTQPADTTTSMGSFQQNMQFIFSHFDNEQRREKCVAGMREQLLKGNWVMVPPVGFDKIKINGEGKIVVNDRGQLLRKAFQWKAQGLASEEIRLRLKAQGLTLYPQHLSRIFRNVFYCGYISHSLIGGELVKGNHEALISEELFLKVNGVLSSNHQRYKHKADNLAVSLKRFAKCADCGASLAGYTVLKKGLHYYKCTTKGCRLNVRDKHLNDLFLQLLSRFQVDENLLPALKLQLELTFNELNQSSLEAVKGLKAGISDIEKNLEKLEERYVLEGLERHLYEKYTAKFKEDKRKMEEELQKAGKSISNLSAYTDKSLLIASQSSKLWQEGDFETRGKLQYLVFPEGVQYERKNEAFRTQRINSVFSLMRSLSGGDGTKKEGQTTDFNSLSPRVESEGFEPSSRQGAHQAFYMLIGTLIVGRRQGCHYQHLHLSHCFSLLRRDYAATSVAR